MYNISYKYKSSLLFLIKLFIVGVAFYFISQKVLENKTLLGTVFIKHFDHPILKSFSLITSIILFSLFNWMVEIIKWRTLVSTVQNISFFEAGKQSLSSLTASLLTPNRIGEYGAKAIFFQKNRRLKIMFLNFLGNFSQMSTTVLFGIAGLLFIKTKLTNHFQFNSVELFTAALGLLLVGIFFLKKYWLKYWLKITDHYKTIPNSIHLKIHLLAMARYLIFSHQFYLLLVIFGADITYLIAMPIIFTMYFIASILPGFVIFDWILKGSVAIGLFNLFQIDEILILSITSLMWLLNFALPAIAGSYFVLSYNPKELIFKENSINP